MCILLSHGFFRDSLKAFKCNIFRSPPRCFLWWHLSWLHLFCHSKQRWKRKVSGFEINLSLGFGDDINKWFNWDMRIVFITVILPIGARCPRLHLHRISFSFPYLCRSVNISYGTCCISCFLSISIMLSNRSFLKFNFCRKLVKFLM